MQKPPDTARPLEMNARLCVFSDNGRLKPMKSEKVSDNNELGKQDMNPKQDDTEENNTIPSEYQTSPVTMKELAKVWGGMTTRKLSVLMKSGLKKFKKINRQTYVFDTRYLPNYVVEKLK